MFCEKNLVKAKHYINFVQIKITNHDQAVLPN